MSSVDTIQPLILCGAIFLLGIYVYAYISGHKMKGPNPPCETQVRVSEKHEENLQTRGLDSLMSNRDPWVHHMNVAQRIQGEKPRHRDPIKHPLLDDHLSQMSSLFEGL